MELLAGRLLLHIVGIRFTGAQIHHAAADKEAANHQHTGQRAEQEAGPNRMIERADETDAGYAVAVHLAQCHRCDSEHERQRPGDQMEVAAFLVDAMHVAWLLLEKRQAKSFKYLNINKSNRKNIKKKKSGITGTRMYHRYGLQHLNFL